MSDCLFRKVSEMVRYSSNLGKAREEGVVLKKRTVHLTLASAATNKPIVSPEAMHSSITVKLAHTSLL